MSGELLQQGRTPEQIAAERGLTVGTVYGHLAQLITEGRVGVDAVIPADIQAQVRAAIDAVGSLQYLSPLKSRLPESIEFHIIRCVVNAVAHERGAPPEAGATQASATKAPTTPGPIRAAEVHALGQAAAPDSTPRLLAGLEDPSGNVRRLAASALGKLRLTAGVLPLLTLLENETGPQVRQYAIKALGSIGDARARPLLERLALDPNELEYNRLAAKVALKSLRGR